MASQAKREINDLAQCLRSNGPTVFQSLLAALLIWLFGILVFIPLANSLNWQAGLSCSLIISSAFTVSMYRAASSLKRLIDAFSFLPARKYSVRWELSREDASTVFRYVAYIISGLIVYALYFPFLASFHFAISGIVLIVVLIWIFFLALRILSILSSRILEQLRS
ncbi:MAG TPA: hypothetical protein VMW36_05200 [Patescibacteria group bacterium]|nr:hypothetical protein [Patescibacteria group bacterium]